MIARPIPSFGVIVLAAVGLALSSFLIPARVSLAADGSPAGALQFDYALKEPGFVSAAIYDARGTMVRTLLYAEKQQAGNHHLVWDGLDSYGRPQPPGKYEWRLLRTPGFNREFLLDLGVNITWREHDYWPGNHFGPNRVMVDDAGALYVGSVSSEGPPTMIKIAQDGRQLFWTTGTWGFQDGLVDMARIDRLLYILMFDGALNIYMADKGGYPYGDPKLHHLMTGRSGRGQFASLVHASETKKHPAMRMAGGKDFLAVCYADFNEVRLLWPQDDRFARDETVSVPSPRAAAVAPDGRIFILSGSKILMFRESDRQVRTLVDDKDLMPAGGSDAEHRRSEASSIAYDPAGDEILTALGGQIRRYRATDGKLVVTYGSPQGRHYGVFNPLEFDGILSLTADGKGGFFTAELCPRRVAHFTGREQLKLEKQWFGGMGWEAQAFIDPADPTVAYVPIDYKHLGRATIDYKTRSWTLTHLYETPDTFCWGVNAADQHEGVFPGVSSSALPSFRVRHVEGQTFLVNVRDSVMVVRVDEKENRIVPVALLSSLHPTVHRRNPPAWWIAALKRIGIDADDPTGRGTDRPASFTKAGDYKHFSFSWSDDNRNGAFDIDEVILGSTNPSFTTGFRFVDDDWNVYVAEASGESAWSVIPNEGADKTHPKWNWDHRRPGAGAFPEPLNATALHTTSDGSVYATGKFADFKNWDMPPHCWPNNSVTANRFVKWDKQGRLVFATGFHSAAKLGPAGGFTDLRAIVGEVRGNIVVRDAGAPATVWTPDGLCAGNISNRVPEAYSVDKTRDKPSEGPYTDDCHGGQIIQTPQGDILWCANDANNTMVIRVGGWDGWERQTGAIALTTPTPSALRQGDGLSAEYFANATLTGNPALTRVDPTLWFGPLWGDHSEIRTVHPWIAKGAAAGFEPGQCSARWTGYIESPFTDDMTFTVFTYGRDGAKKGSRVKMWLDGKLVIDSWDTFTLCPDDGAWGPTRSATSVPIPMKAGLKTPIKIEYASSGGANAHFHLYWETRTSEQRHVPQSALYTKP